MREIKFRGICIEPPPRRKGQFVYGDLIHMTGNRMGVYYDHRIACVEVDPDSVAQLVGHDADGEEVYEGDLLINPTDGTTFKARMNHIFTVSHYRSVKEAAR